MSMDDGGWDSDPEDGGPSDGVTSPGGADPGGRAESLAPPPSAAPPDRDRTTGFSNPDGGAWRGSARLANKQILAIIAAAVIVVGGGTGIALALSGGKKSPSSVSTTTPATSPSTQNTPVTASGPTSPATTASSTTAPSKSTSGNLLSNTPFDSCAEVAAAQRPYSEISDEIACTGSDVNAEGGSAAFYATFPSSSIAQQYIAALDSTASAPSPDCSTITLGAGNALCDFEDEDSEGGVAVMAIDPTFVFGPNGATAAATCASLSASSTEGFSVLAWDYSGSATVGAIFSCRESTEALSSMRTGLLSSDFELDNQ